MPEVQEALANARALTLRMTNVLSSSNLHREHGSSIQSLYQQATRLNNFTLPSSRIVGLVGDSGVGKSSLINSLLDKLEVARAVSDRYTAISYSFLTQRPLEQQRHCMYMRRDGISLPR